MTENTWVFLGVKFTSTNQGPQPAGPWKDGSHRFFVFLMRVPEGFMGGKNWNFPCIIFWERFGAISKETDDVDSLIDTSPKFSIEPENDTVQKGSPFPGPFLGSMLNFRGVDHFYRDILWGRLLDRRGAITRFPKPSRTLLDVLVPFWVGAERGWNVDLFDEPYIAHE